MTSRIVQPFFFSAERQQEVPNRINQGHPFVVAFPICPIVPTQPYIHDAPSRYRNSAHIRPDSTTWKLECIPSVDIKYDGIRHLLMPAEQKHSHTIQLGKTL